MKRAMYLKAGCGLLLAVFVIGALGCGGGAAKPVDGPPVTSPQEPTAMPKPPAPPKPPAGG